MKHEADSVKGVRDAVSIVIPTRKRRYRQGENVRQALNNGTEVLNADRRKITRDFGDTGRVVAAQVSSRLERSVAIGSHCWLWEHGLHGKSGTEGCPWA